MLTLTERKVIERLKENTGRHMLDSGGAYGRNWERNQGKSFVDEPYATVNFKYGVEYSQSVYHFLTEHVEYDFRLQSAFTRFAHSKEMEDENWLVCMEKFAERRGGAKHGEGIFTDNSYNGNSNLSQVIQYTAWYDNDGNCYGLVQIHGGCDVRGGYSTPLAVQLEGIYDLACSADGRIFCEHCGASWYTDDDYNWYGEEYWPEHHDTPGQLHLFEVKETYLLTDDLKNFSMVTEDNDAPHTIFVNDEGQAKCPYCKEGHIVAAAA